MEDNDHRETEIVHHVKEQVSQKEKIPAVFRQETPFACLPVQWEVLPGTCVAPGSSLRSRVQIPRLLFAEV